jgi:hypothetical protein
MVRRHESVSQPLKREVEEKSDTALAIVSVVGLVACVLINAVYSDSVPDIVFWILGLSISKDFIKIAGMKR